MKKSLIVIIDNSSEVLETAAMVLEENGFEVQKFFNFEDASLFLESHTPDLIISDLIGHENIQGVEFLINNIMSQKINFALWSGNMDLLNGDPDNLSVFFEGMPENYRVAYNPVTALSQNQVDLIIKDFSNNQSSRLPAFSKTTSIRDILKYFQMPIK